jgi:hypothetical protein
LASSANANPAASAASLLACATAVVNSTAQTNEALINALIQKGILTQSEASEIKEQLEAKPGPLVRPSSHNIKDLQIRGRIQCHTIVTGPSKGCDTDP